MTRATALVCLAGAFLSACAPARDQAAPPTLPPGGALVKFGPHVVAAEIAAAPDDRATGLMHREHLEEDAAMLFLFPSATAGGFWMKDTRIPLSIAFMQQLGSRTFRVIAVLDMEPCSRTPCPSYAPGDPYHAALEVNKGWFDERRIRDGAVARVEGKVPAPS